MDEKHHTNDRKVTPDGAGMELPLAKASAIASATLWFKQGLALIEQQRWAEAIPHFDRALQLDERHAGAWALRGAAHAGVQDFAAALADAERALALAAAGAPFPARLIPPVVELQARSLYQLGRDEDALERLAELQRLEPPTTFQWALLGDTHRALQQHQEAISAYHQLVTHPQRNSLRSATSVVSWLTIAQYLFDQRAYHDALEASHLAVQVDPEQVNGWELQAQVWLALEQPEEALAAASRALTMDARSFAGWVMRARAACALRHDSEAHDAYEHARALVPTDDRRWSQLVSEEANMLFRLGRLKAWAAFLDVKNRQKLGLPQQGVGPEDEHGA